MLRTNSKKAKANLHNYIIETADFQAYSYDKYSYLYDPFYENVDTWSMWKECVKDTFYHEKVLYDTRHLPRYELFKEWLQGLPLALGDYYYNQSAIEILGNILEETEEERNHFTEEQAKEKLTYLLYRELFS